MPQRAALFARKSDARKPQGVSWGFFVVEHKFLLRGES